MAKLLTILLLAAGIVRADDTGLSLQVTLDRLGFSPGVIDGRPGPQTRLAVAAWQIASGLPATGELTGPHAPALLPADQLFTNYTVTAADLAELGPFPTDWKARSQLPRLAHTNLLELVAEKFHASERLIRSLNPHVTDWSAVAPESIVIALHVAPLGPARPAARVRVSLGEKFIRAFDANGVLIAHFPCSIAARQEKRPVGELTVINLAPNPNYTFDPAVFPELPAEQRAYGKLIIPPGPNNPVGLAWIGLSRPGYGIHGTPFPEDIGRTESHGCFRLANWNATRLLRMVTVGTPVEVTE